MKQALFCHRPMVIQHPIEKWLKKFFGSTKLLFSFDKIAFLFHKIAFLFKEVVFFIKKNCFFYSTSLLFIRQNCFLFLTKWLFYSTKCFFIQQNYSFVRWNNFFLFSTKLLTRGVARTENAWEKEAEAAAPQNIFRTVAFGQEEQLDQGNWRE